MNDPLTSRPDTGAPGGMTGFANPSVNVTLSTQNGTAVTAMRSDAAPALSQAISPTWTAGHIFSATSLGTGWTQRVSLQNLTNATNGSQQDSPVLSWFGKAWDVTGGQSTLVSAESKVFGTQTAGRPQVTLQFRTTVNGGDTRTSLAVVQPFTGRADVIACDRGAGSTTSDTTGFLYIPSVAGAPTGVPTNTASGTVPIQYDTTNNKLYVYNGGWKSVTLA